MRFSLTVSLGRKKPLLGTAGNLVASDMDKRIAKQVPFATARALTQLAHDARKEAAGKELSDAFTLRNKFLASSINMARKATKHDLRSAVGIKSRAKGAPADWMEQQIEGGDRMKPGGVPVGLRKPGGKRKVGPSLWPGKLAKGGRFFYGTTKKGVRALWQRLKKRNKSPGPYLRGPKKGTPRPGRESLKMVYLFPTDVKIAKRYSLEAPVRRVVKDGWVRTMKASLDKALMDSLTRG